MKNVHNVTVFFFGILLRLSVGNANFTATDFLATQFFLNRTTKHTIYKKLLVQGSKKRKT
jgi:hypothetical protein